EPVERVVLERADHRAEELAQRLARVLFEIHEHEARPHVAVHRDEPVAALVEAEELALLLHELERAVEAVAPPVVLAGELAARAARLVARVVAPDQLVAAVPAEVVERPHAPAAVPHDHDRGARDLELAREVAAVARQLLDPAHREPRPPEDRVALE